MECVNCGDRNGPWIYVDRIGMLCEKCLARKAAVEGLIKYINYEKEDRKSISDIDIVALIDSVCESAYDELGLR